VQTHYTNNVWQFEFMTMETDYMIELTSEWSVCVNDLDSCKYFVNFERSLSHYRY